MADEGADRPVPDPDVPPSDPRLSGRSVPDSISDSVSDSVPGAVSDSVSGSVSDSADASADASADDGSDGEARARRSAKEVTQSLPVVVTGPDGRVGDPPSVVGVARRPATALPSLGRTDGPAGLPTSVRATVDRRRHATAAGEVGAGHGTDQRSDDMPTPASESQPAAALDPREPPHTGVGETVVDEPVVHVDPPLPGQYASPRRIGPTLDAAYRYDKSDEWVVPVERAPDVEVRAYPIPLARTGPTQPGRAEPVLAEAETGDDRPGPSLLQADSWDSAVPVVWENDDYHGRRRAASPLARRLLIVALVLVGVGVVAIPWALTSGGPGVATGPVPTIAENAGGDTGTSLPPEVSVTSAMPVVTTTTPKPPGAPSPSSTPKATSAPPVVLLSGKRPTATSALEDGGSLVGSNAVDGNPSTRWGSAWSDPQWISVDLGSTCAITRVKLSWETAYGRAYQVQTSADNTNWTTVYSTTSGDGGIDDINLTGTGRWVRIFGTQRATQWGYSLWELEIYGSLT